MCDAIFITSRLARADDNGARCTHQPRGRETLLRQRSGPRVKLRVLCGWAEQLTVADNGCGIKAQHLPHLTRRAAWQALGRRSAR
jgi:signal transduction histidine kinase